MRFRLLFFLFTIQSISLIARDDVKPKTVTAHRLSSNIILDGILNESVWKLPSVSDFTQSDPDEGKPSSEKTNVWIAYDEEAIYVAAKLYDSKPEEIDSSLVRRDSWIDSDWFYFYVDPYQDKKTGYFFAVNAGGSLIDGTYYNDNSNDYSWDGIWEAKSQINEDGWEVEIKIPISQLRFNQKEDQIWGVNFCREIKRINEHSYFVMVPKNESGFVSRFAHLDGLHDIMPKKRFEIIPYFVQKAQYLEHNSDDPFYKGNQYKTAIGADMKIGLSSNLNLDVTINPDFGQVEVDPAVVNLSAFETYFPEKRPFFIEGKSLFYFGIGGSNNNQKFDFDWPELFYSRRIGSSPHGGVGNYDFLDAPHETRILGAAKITGKLGNNWSIGGISAVTERTFANYDYDGVRAEKEIEPVAHYGVLRTKKEFNSGAQGLGLMFTTVNRDLRIDAMRELLSKNSFTGGVDGWTFLDSKKLYVISGAFAASYVSGTKEYVNNLQKASYRYFQRPDKVSSRLDPNKTSLEGYFGRVMLNKQSGNFYVNAALGAVSPGFENNDIGFQKIADRINGHLVLGYRWYEPDSLFRTKSIYIAHAESYDFDGNNTANYLWTKGDVEFHNYWGVGFYTTLNFPNISSSTTRGGVLMKTPGSVLAGFWGYTDSREKLVFNYGVDYWNLSYGSFGLTYSLNAEWKPNSQITFSIGPQFTRNVQKEQFIKNIKDEQAVSTLGIRSIFGEMDQKTISANIRLNWTFSPALSLQLFLQPLFSVGAYQNIKELANPKSNDFNYYNEVGNINYDTDDKKYTIDPDKDGPANSFTIGNPDFNFKSIRGNIVLRWEVMPGSIFYLVWSHDRTNYDNPGDFKFGRDFSNLMEADANNIFMVKFSHWLDM